MLHAVDAGLPGGLRKAWPEFARAAWNQDPVEPDFEGWDNFTQHPEEDGQEIAAQNVDAGASGQTEVDMPLGLGPLTRAYKYLRFGPHVTEITVDKPSYPDLSVQAILRLRDGTVTTQDWSQGQPTFCPKDPGKRPAELVLVVANSSLGRPSPSGVNSRLRVVATNTGCSRYRGECSGSSTAQGPDTNMTETWHATGLVYDRYLDNLGPVPRFLFHLTGGSVSWSLRGTEYGCAVSAGPVTLPVSRDGYDGQLDIHVVVLHSATPTPARAYVANGYGLPSVQGTVTCPHGSPYTRYFSPHAFLQTTNNPTSLRAIGGDGVLQGTQSYNEGAGTSSTYRWRLVPDR